MTQSEKDKLIENYQDEPPIKVDRLARVKALLGLRQAIAVDHVDCDLANQITEILQKTYVVCGDAASITDDQALMMINDLLLRHDAGMSQRRMGE